MGEWLTRMIWRRDPTPGWRARGQRAQRRREPDATATCFTVLNIPLRLAARGAPAALGAPVVIVADLRAMADWLPPQAQRVSGISCVGLALDGSSYLTRHSFQQIGERNPTLEDLSHPAWQWDEQAVQSTNQRMEGLAINALRLD